MVADSYAMDAASSMHTCLYRSGYDISLPLNPRKTSRDLAEMAPLGRRFFLTLRVRKRDRTRRSILELGTPQRLDAFVRLRSRLNNFCGPEHVYVPWELTPSINFHQTVASETRAIPAEVAVGRCRIRWDEYETHTEASHS